MVDFDQFERMVFSEKYFDVVGNCKMCYLIVGLDGWDLGHTLAILTEEEDLRDLVLADL